MENEVMGKFFAFPLMVFAASSIFASGSNTYGLPSYLDVQTFTLNLYQNGNNLSRSHLEGDEFANTLKTLLSSKYPAISSSRVAYKDDQVTRANYFATLSRIYELTFFCGHGDADGAGEISYDIRSLTPGTTAMGGWNRWYFSSGCKVLWNNTASYYASMFGGLHAFFGYASNTIENIKSYSCGVFSTCHYRTEDLWGIMWDKWLRGNYPMWTAFTEAARIDYYEHFHYGVRPATVYLLGMVNGTSFVGHTEMPNTVFNGDVDKNTLSISYSWMDYGTPSY
jgi:hypothetical protein